MLIVASRRDIQNINKGPGLHPPTLANPNPLKRNGRSAVQANAGPRQPAFQLPVPPKAGQRSGESRGGGGDPLSGPLKMLCSVLNHIGDFPNVLLGSL